LKKEVVIGRKDRRKIRKYARKKEEMNTDILETEKTYLVVILNYREVWISWG
jgi:hypothetical protein